MKEIPPCKVKCYRLLKIHGKCVEYIKTEKAQLKELESQIRKVEKEVIKLRSSQETDERVLDKANAKERNIHLLEGRLHNVSVTSFPTMKLKLSFLKM